MLHNYYPHIFSVEISLEFFQNLKIYQKIHICSFYKKIPSYPLKVSNHFCDSQQK